MINSVAELWTMFFRSKESEPCNYLEELGWKRWHIWSGPWRVGMAVGWKQLKGQFLQTGQWALSGSHEAEL